MHQGTKARGQVDTKVPKARVQDRSETLKLLEFESAQGTFSSRYILFLGLFIFGSREMFSSPRSQS